MVKVEYCAMLRLVSYLFDRTFFSCGGIILFIISQPFGIISVSLENQKINNVRIIFRLQLFLAYSIYILPMTFRFMNCKLSIQKRPKYEEKIFVAIQLSTNLRFIKYDLRKLTKETKAIVLQI